MRRINYSRGIFVSVAVFVAVFLFVFLLKISDGDMEVSAADLTKFDPGYIM